ncbi:MAG: methylase involved in ubiquinone/menaquinone biosynthesi [Parcubacteria group bacterium Gr01-1014_46]|nr:MAG: methylase involved in ubiquinone/menaquinone biosynthesi [Parcubacteria group bacterium Gr01-1014_46]
METKNLFNQEIDNLTEVLDQRKAFRNIVFKDSSKIFKIKDKKVYFMEIAGDGFNDENTDVIVNKIKLLLKKVPWVFSTIYKIMNPTWSGVSSNKAVSQFAPGSVILNLGSGVTVVRPDIINVDFYPFQNVNFVADIANLPFAPASVDAIVCETVLEHVPNPKVVVTEMHRVLRPGGLIYIVVPFVFAFHSSPNDFYRWSKMGLQEELKDFKKIDSGIYYGAGHAVSWTLSEYLGTILSFGSKKLHQILFMIFLVLTTPLSYLDFIFKKFKSSENIASCIYFIGTKK